MATKTISGKVTGPDGTNKAAVIVVTLNVPTLIAGTSEQVPSQIKTTAAADGTFALTLQANGDMTPSGSFYTVTEISPDGGAAVWTPVIVPQTAGPFILSNLIGAIPALTPGPGHVSTLTVDGQATFTAGPVIIGTDPGGGQLLRVGGSGHFSGVVTLDSGLGVAGTIGVGVGQPAVSNFAINISGATVLTGGGGAQYGIASYPTMDQSATTSGSAVYAQLQTKAAAFTMASGYGLYLANATKGAGSAITTQYGIFVENLSAGVSNFALYTNSGPISLGDSLTVRANGAAITGATTVTGIATITANVGSQLVLDSGGNASQNTGIDFRRNAVGKWTIGNLQGTDILQVYDLVNTRQALTISSAGVTISIGELTLPASGASQIAIYNLGNTQSGNYETARSLWSSNIFYIQNAWGGTGVQRALAFNQWLSTTFNTAVIVSSGGLTVSAGGLTVSAGGATFPKGSGANSIYLGAGVLGSFDANVPFFLKNDGGAADAKFWDLLPGTNRIAFRATNDNYSSANEIWSVLRSGFALTSMTINPDALFARGAAFWGHAAVASQPVAPATLADVIAIIRGCGLSA